MYAPTWEKRLDIQSKLRKLSDDDIFTGTKQIYNHSYNPGVAPTTQTLNELSTIDEQNVNNVQKNKIDAYANLISLLETDVTESFIAKFKKLFKIFIEPDSTLYYKTRKMEE